MELYRRFIEGAATLLNLLLGTTLLWPPRPNGLRARMRRIVMRVRQNPDLVIEFVYALRYPLAAFSTLFSAAVVGFAFIEMRDTPGTLAGKLAGAAFIAGVGVLTVGAGRVTARYAAARRVARTESASPSKQLSRNSGTAREMSPIRRLARHVYLLHLMLLIGAGGILLLGVIGFSLEMIHGAFAYHPQFSYVALWVLLILQGTVTLVPILRRIRR